MRVYVVVGVCQGMVESVNGFIDPGQADLELSRVKSELGIVPGHEEESGNDAQIHEIDIDARAVSVSIRRQVW